MRARLTTPSDFLCAAAYEKVRAGYFQRQGRIRQAEDCLELAQRHEAAARKAAEADGLEIAGGVGP